MRSAAVRAASLIGVLVLGTKASARAASTSTISPAYAAVPRGRDSLLGYEAQSGTSRTAANFAHAASPAKSPRATPEVTSTKPQTRSAGMIASFEFELETYCVNG